MLFVENKQEKLIEGVQTEGKVERSLGCVIQFL